MANLTALGLASAPSLEGVAIALVNTDGAGVVEQGPVGFAPYSRDLKVFIRRAIKAAQEGREGAADIGKAAGEITNAHAIAIEDFLERNQTKRAAIDVIGYSGPLILRRPRRGEQSVGRIWRIGEAAVLAAQTRIDVVTDIHSADVQAGGEGEPLNTVYLAALVRALEPDGAVAVLDLGENASLSFIPRIGTDLDLLAFDCGPAIGLIDEWIALKCGADGHNANALARAGKVHSDILRAMLLNPYFRRRPPKLLDRHDFKLEPLLMLPAEDGAATLTAFAAASVRAATAHLPTPPNDWIITGAGRGNAALLEAIGKAIEGEIHDGESLGWRCDGLEAACNAYLAVRSLKKLPLTFPKTTRTPRPTLGGVFHRAPG